MEWFNFLFHEDSDQEDSDENDYEFDSNVATMAETIPVTIRNRMQNRLNNLAAYNLTIAFENCFIMDWEMFATSALNLTKGDVLNIDCDCKRRTEKINRMFERWLEMEEEATFAKIIDIFEKANLLGVLQQWYSQYRIEEEKAALQRHFRFYDDAMYQISHRNISDADWEKCLHQLDIHQKLQEVQATNKSLPVQRKRILSMYGDKYGYGQASTDRLFEVISTLPDRPRLRQETSQIHPFFVRRRTPAIRRCQGCRGFINRSNAEVIAHLEWIKYKTKGQLVDDFTYGHYHYDEGCVRQRHPGFRMADLTTR